MAHSRPVGGVFNAADGERLARAVEALVGVLAEDLRVRADYDTWLRTSGLSVSIAQLRVRQTVEDIEAFGMVLDSGAATNLEPFQLLVRDRLALSYEWLPQLLLVLYRASAYSDASGEGITFALQVPPTAFLPAGRKPRHGGRDIVRNVRWFYRVSIKHPKDDIHDLAQEYASVSGRNNDARSVVQNGIKQAKALLELVDVH